MPSHYSNIPNLFGNLTQEEFKRRFGGGAPSAMPGYPRAMPPGDGMSIFEQYGMSMEELAQMASRDPRVLPMAQALGIAPPPIPYRTDEELLELQAQLIALEEDMLTEGPPEISPEDYLSATPYQEWVEGGYVRDPNAYDVYTDEELERFWDLEDEFDYADRVEPFAGDVGSMQLLEQRIADAEKALAEDDAYTGGRTEKEITEDPSIYWDLETAEDAGFVVTPEDLIAEGFSPEDDIKSIELLEQRIAAKKEEEEEERRRAGVVPEQPGIGGPPPVPSGLADAARADAFAGLTDYEDWLEPYGRPAHEYWEGVTAQLDPFWQVRAPAAELGRRLQSRYLLEYPEMSVDPSGVSPTFGQYFQDWRPYAAGGFAEGTAPSYYSDPTQLLARARQAGLAGITEPGKFAESYQYGDPDFLRAAWLSSQFGPGVQGAAANQRAVASLLALQRPTGGAYGGQMANAIRNAVFNVQQRRKALGADPGSFLHWFANPEVRSSPALMAPNIRPEWRQALKNPVSPIGL